MQRNGFYLFLFVVLLKALLLRMTTFLTAPVSTSIPYTVYGTLLSGMDGEPVTGAHLFLRAGGAANGRSSVSPSTSRSA